MTQIIVIIHRYSSKEANISQETTARSTSLPIPTTTSTSHTITGSSHTQNLDINEPEDDEETLINQYSIDGAAADEILGYDDDEDEEYNGDVGPGDDDEDGKLPNGDLEFKAFQRQVRIDETRRAEGNRRAGGIKTQRAMVKAWEVS